MKDQLTSAQTKATRTDMAKADGMNGKSLETLLNPELLGNVTVELNASLGRGRLTLQRLASLEKDEIITLDTPLNGTVDLVLNNMLVARGEIVTVDDLFGVRITEIVARRA